jgi:tetratricopeptide (TPR) repeat protein
MKQVFILIAILFATFNLSAQSNQFQQANEAYAKGDFQAAADLYEAMLKANGESANVYYNLGNCYYKLNKIAPGILNYERALLLQPGNADIQFNLEIARLKTVDKIEPIGNFFLTDWFHHIQNLLSTDAWSYSGIVFFILLIACLFLFFFSRRVFVKQLGFYLSLLLLIGVIFGNIFAYNQKRKLTQRNAAIIFAPTTTIKSSPDDSGTDLFILHEGTKVQLKNKLGGWNEIETANGNVGWIKSLEIQVI